MKKLKLLLAGSFLGLLFVVPNIVQADTYITEDGILNEVQNFSDIQIKASVGQATEDFEIEIEEVPTNSLYSLNPNEVTKGFEATFYFPVEEKSSDELPGIVPFATGSSGKNEAGVSAYLEVTYTKNASGNKINITNVSGSWTPNNEFYLLTERRVIPRSGTIFGDGIETLYTPTSNSFSYNIHWGLVDYYAPNAYQRSGANSTVLVYVAGIDLFTPVDLTVAV